MFSILLSVFTLLKAIFLLSMFGNLARHDFGTAQPHLVNYNCLLPQEGYIWLFEKLEFQGPTGPSL